MAVTPPSGTAAPSRHAAPDRSHGLASPEWGGFDPARTRGSGASDVRRTFMTATRLGWQMEANWTDPALFFIYSIAKPVSAALILVVMLEVIGGARARDMRGFVVVGSALWAFVVSGVAGLGLSILDDRERYRMLKYVYVAPSDFLVVILGRGVARLAVGGMGAAITLAIGVLALGVTFDIASVNWPLLVATIVLGVVAIVAVGAVIAAVTLQTRQESWSYPEAVAGALFLVAGVVFPLAVLPTPVQVIGLLTPLTWWLAGLREALFPGGLSSVGGEGALWTGLTGRLAPTPIETLLALLATGALATLASIVVFRISERRAKDAGLLDMTTGS